MSDTPPVTLVESPAEPLPATEPVTGGTTTGGTTPPTPPNSPKMKLSWKMVGLIGAVVAIVLIVGGTSTYFYLQANTDANQSSTVTPTPTTTSTPTPTAMDHMTMTPTPTPTPTTDPYANWQTYTHPKGYFSFKYPTQWQVKYTVVDSTHNSDYVDLLQDGQVVASVVSQYADGTGCGDDTQTKTHPITFGGQTVTATSECGDERYSAGAKLNGATKPSTSLAIVKAAFGINIDTQLDLWSKSLDGVIPAQ